MVAIRIQGFRGEIPRREARLLEQNYAQQAMNSKVSSGALVPLRRPELVGDFSLTSSSVRTLYRFSPFDPAQGSDKSVWLTWGESVQVARSPIANDPKKRLYVSSSDAFEPRMTSWVDGVEGKSAPYPADYYLLGVRSPDAVPEVLVSGGSADVESRAYVYTYKTRYGEESGVSGAVLGSGASDGEWTVSGFEDVPVNYADVLIASGDGARVTISSSTAFVGLRVGDTVDIDSTGLSVQGVRVVELVSSSSFVVDYQGFDGVTAGGSWSRCAKHHTEGMVRRVYRSQRVDSTYRLVGEIDLDVDSFVDELSATELSLQPALTTLESAVPPVGLHRLITLANGALCGLNGDELCFSTPYLPHSWPVKYRYSIPASCVALVAVGNSVIVLTSDDYHYLASSVTPDAVSITKIESNVFAPCVAADGVVDIGRGAIYPSHDGLYIASAAGVQNVTSNLYRRKEWQGLNPSSFRAVQHDSLYYASYEDVSGVRRVWVLDMPEADSVSHVDYAVDGLYVDSSDGCLYGAKDGKVFAWDDEAAGNMLAFWESKIFVWPVPLNMGVAQVYADYSASGVVGDDVQIGVVGGVNTRLVASNGLNASKVVENAALLVLQKVGVMFSLYVKGELKYSRQVMSSEPFRLPAGYKADECVIQIASTVTVHSVHVAETVRELKQT